MPPTNAQHGKGVAGHSRRPGHGSADVQLTAARNEMKIRPGMRDEPLLMQQWKYLWREEFVELGQGSRITDAGWVDDITPDGNIVWVYLLGGKGRMLIHRHDGINIWRVESRILQNRSEPEER